MIELPDVPPRPRRHDQVQAPVLRSVYTSIQRNSSLIPALFGECGQGVSVETGMKPQLLRSIPNLAIRLRAKKPVARCPSPCTGHVAGRRMRLQKAIARASPACRSASALPRPARHRYDQNQHNPEKIVCRNRGRFIRDPAASRPRHAPKIPGRPSPEGIEAWARIAPPCVHNRIGKWERQENPPERGVHGSLSAPSL